jgi:predicted nucleic acid-binding protein
MPVAGSNPVTSAPAVFVVDASIVVRWLVGGPFEDACQAFLDRCVARDARLLAPTCLYSEVANALYRLCLAAPPLPVILPSEAINFVQSLAGYDIALVDKVHRTPSGTITLTPQWEQLPDGTIRDYRGDIYARSIALSFPSRRSSLFDMAYAALAEQAGTTMWTIDERFYNGARAQGLSYIMHPSRDPLP